MRRRQAKRLQQVSGQIINVRLTATPAELIFLDSILNYVGSWMDWVEREGKKTE